ncbi:MAG: UDP-N-acetylglucosamine--N-acetylmuramyl-(pentapeptide) pyrophosphoryl-undecaprenol N-acetylglucosamine transferase [Candidatus Pacebacteria bacterium]|nr:UDP-N-acetylglucosamine--N-acetylmuramyl-(pentapeptide) pyrophosphoryl-undecaprenol N-acetylglucosamine transferase [Candidatus Paceibacterota bacterium]
MKIVFTGGGSGGHFYPIIAIAQSINNIASEKKLVDVKMYYISNSPYDEGLLFDNNIIFKRNTAGKRRRYFSLLNIIDLFKIFFGTITATWTLFKIYPDVVFGKGGFASFPTLFAARILKIPVIIHESDTVPGRVNAWAGKFAKRIAIAFPEAGNHFPKERTALVGNPVRKELQNPVPEGAFDFLKLEKDIPVILVLGGSQGAEMINDNLMDALPDLLNRFQVIHQTGNEKLKAVEEMSRATLLNHPHKERYKIFPYLNTLAMRMAAGASSIVISRAGAASISEISSWKVPSIIIPITDSNGDHQRKNAFAYARSGACSVIEEKNLSKNIIISECNRIIESSDIRESMKKAAGEFNKPNASDKLAEEIIELAIEHS